MLSSLFARRPTTTRAPGSGKEVAASLHGRRFPPPRSFCARGPWLFAHPVSPNPEIDMNRTHIVFGAVLLAGSLAVATASAQFASYGSALAVGDDEVLVGQPLSLGDPGAVFVFRREEDGAWREAARLQGPSPVFGDGFGASLALDGGTLLVSAFGQTPFPGGPPKVVYVFERGDDGAWRQVDRWTPPEGAEGFGAQVALSGDVAMVGAFAEAEGTGAVYVYRRDAAGAWRLQAKLTGSDTTAGDRFGARVALSGDRALVGAPRRDDGMGAVYDFEYDAEAEAWREAGVLAPPTLDDGAHFGAAFMLAGDWALVSAPQLRGGVGAAFAFHFDDEAGEWVDVGTLAPFDARPGMQFGAALAVGVGAVWIGAPGGRETPGSVYVYHLDERGQWRRADKRNARRPDLGDGFGTGLAARGDRVVVGAPGADYGLGRAVLYVRGEAGDWREDAALITESHAPSTIAGGMQSCADGAASGFACDNVDLVSFLSVEDLGGVRGVFVNDLWGWTDPETGKEYALVGRNDGLAFVDLSNPENPVFVGELPRPEGVPASLWRDVKVYKDHAFIVADGAGPHGMQVFDLTRLRDVTDPPVTFTEDAHYDRIHSAHNIVINEDTGFAYAVAASMGGETCGGGLHMIDVRDPEHPTFAGCFSHEGTGNSGTGTTHDAQCVTYHGPDARYRGHEICLGSNETALSIADVTDKQNPKVLAKASYPNVAYAHQGWLTEDHRYFYMNDEGDEMIGAVPGTRTLIWDVSDLEDPQLVGAHVSRNPAIDHNLYVKGDLMYQSNYVSGLRVLDVTDREHPVEVGFFDTVAGPDAAVFNGSWSNYPYFESGLIVVTSMREGLFVVRKRDVDL